MRQILRKTALPLAVALSVAACGPGGGSTPDAAVQAFYDAINHSEIAKARQQYYLPASSDFWEQAAVASLTEEAEGTRKCGGVKSVTVEVLPGEGDIRDVTTHVAYNGACVQKDDTTKLMRIDSLWKVTRFMTLKEHLHRLYNADGNRRFGEVVKGPLFVAPGAKAVRK
jgi:hypothetical protein